MAADWKKTALASVMDVKHGFAFPGENIRDEPPGDILLTPGNFAIGGGFKGDKFKYFDGHVPDDYVLNEGDLVVTMTDLSKQADTLGYPAIVPRASGPRFLHNQRLGKVLIKADAELDGRFLFYLLCTAEYRHEVLASATGTTVKHTSPGRILAHIAELPTLNEQRTIAHILGTLDDKIALNRRMNETLEAMARALFKSWFVDFDPVHAKAEGHAPAGMDRETAKLFPGQFVDSKFGRIPKGWRHATLGAEVERCGGAIQTGPFGSQLHASDYVPEGIPVVMPKDIDGRRVSTSSIARIREHDADRLSRHRLQPGDVVYSRRGDVERHALIGPREAGWLCGTGCLLVRLGSNWASPMFASFALDRPETRAWISQHAIGATMPNLNTGILSAVPLVMPPNDVLYAFGRMVDPLQSLVVVHDAETGILATKRSELLPRLLSRDISISEQRR